MNVSTRGYVQDGENVMIAGFIITGEQAKKVFLRGIGPSLAAFGVQGALLEPKIQLYDGAGALLASEQLEHQDVSSTDPSEPVIVATLTPGHYTAVLSGTQNQPGVALVELYDLDPSVSRVAALSTRGKIETGDNVLIGGFIVGGQQPGNVVVRAIGPTLTQSGIENALQDPKLELFDGSGSLIFANDNWRSDQQEQLLNSLIAPEDDRESAMVATLLPGNYTAVVRGSGNSTGVALVEIYYISP
jgi:hypothetical protein